ncbi:sigma-E factor negative regulatory protein RseA [Hydrogenophaga palleronii]|uniref:Sigma-E factor negative regulatory protein RseA n=1 Tax=Hydrogenophaga palleronii TaxID=65655 RepID=A0ABU1WPJ3_9BURK|nr:anti-anti-sigma factor [Hydrogenophaga palleronii]MDR7151215.1 sigma-E factor negative regulatory protein RseA [Hydrogenophaga palleronii]
MDGAISDQDWDALWQCAPHPSAAHENWNAYQVVRDALRGGAPLAAATPPAAFLASFQARFHQELAAAPKKKVSENPTGVTSPGERVRVAAANDSTFRWKMLAMAASVSAVMAVSWGVLGTVTADRAAQPGPELALASPPVPSEEAVVAEPGSANTSVIVNTGQGPLIRDARLEALLAEHRQYGGMTALQKPAGFLRNATYDALDR